MTHEPDVVDVHNTIERNIATVDGEVVVAYKALPVAIKAVVEVEEMASAGTGRRPEVPGNVL